MIITALYIGLNALLLFFLTFYVIMRRRAIQQSLGDGGDKLLMRRIRAHGNAAETMPMALLVIAATEAMGGPAWVVHGLGLALTIGRISHAYALLQTGASFFWRQMGMILTFVVLGLGALALTIHALLRVLG